MAFENLIDIREEYIEIIKKDLYGPGSEISIPDAEHELISDRPDQRYSIGVLFPKDVKRHADNNEKEPESRIEEQEYSSQDEEDIHVEVNHVSDAENDENLDEEIGLAAQNMPSSFGVTFFVKGKCEKINCKLNFATYRKAKADDCRIPLIEEWPDNYELSPFLAQYIYYDKEENTLKLQSGGINGKNVHDLSENGNLTDYERNVIINGMYKLVTQLSRGYVRKPHCSDVILDFSSNDYIDNNKNIDDTVLKVTATRRKVSDDIWAITIMAVNDFVGTHKDERYILQPKITVNTQNNDFVFIDYNKNVDISTLSDEEQSLELQYRNKKVYGTGLGVAVDWKIDETGKGELYTEFFPKSEIPAMDFTVSKKYSFDERVFSMKYLSDLDNTDKSEKIELLTLFIDTYSKWISELKVLSNSLESKYSYISKKNITGCEESCKRMYKGIELLKTDSKIWNAFALANRAMFMQRVHLKIQQSDNDIYPGDEKLSTILDTIDYNTAEKLFEDKYSWRPFQLAFLLMSVESVTDDKSPERELTDLIWFPTGGGKTEAYLGLTAMTIFYRRLAYPNNSDGTTVIMRYTLRLLAAQQFTRASTLICACEYIRDDSMSRKPRYKSYPLGDTSITIGLWIGGEHTPNRNDDAKKLLDELIKAKASDLNYRLDKNNKFQVLKCPWCGTKMIKGLFNNKLKGSFGYVMRQKKHFELHCTQQACPFSSDIFGKLPIQIVDEEIYYNPPTLLFGTVDKFAMMTWKKEVGAFFGVDTDNRPPELIIQDELHLISGPLGTMVGLYEAAIEKICSSRGSKPKIVASTATIRRAKEQCAALYNREVRQFPHPGIDSDDSFFARESKIDHSKNTFGRMYVGLMPSGKTKATMEIRTIASLLQRINKMELSDSTKDLFWTLTVYFNSLKDLGKCATLMEDDVRDSMRRIALRVGTTADIRPIWQIDELTSRVSTTKLNQTLDKIEKVSYSKENIKNKRYASNAVLATNMISVGIDVARLNVMLMVGQPKLTSEYIQATSRVGRSYPGVAFILYDGAKSRDRSHYEQYKAYHESFYKHVEPTGVTPFSQPARERAMHSVVIAILRNTVPDLSEENNAFNYSKELYRNEVKEVEEYIINRCDSINKMVNPKLTSEAENITEELTHFFERWEDLSDQYDKDHFGYGEKFMVKNPTEADGCLLKAYNTRPYDQAIDTMTSLRNVDKTIASNILIWEE
ncbi:MAG: helicase [Ruminococcus sp.]|nr:helicase [Ruminococcus sp.]